MRSIRSTGPLALAAREIVELPDPAGLRLECTGGHLWITLDDDPVDYVLGAGESFATLQHRRALVYAFRAAGLRVSALPDPQLTKPSQTSLRPVSSMPA